MEWFDQNFILPVQSLVVNSQLLIEKCEKPDYKEFKASVTRTLLGFAVLGFIGIFVKVVFIPVNSVIMGK